MPSQHHNPLHSTSHHHPYNPNAPRSKRDRFHWSSFFDGSKNAATISDSSSTSGGQPHPNQQGGTMVVNHQQQQAPSSLNLPSMGNNLIFTATTTPTLQKSSNSLHVSSSNPTSSIDRDHATSNFQFVNHVNTVATDNGTVNVGSFSGSQLDMFPSTSNNNIPSPETLSHNYGMGTGSHGVDVGLPSTRTMSTTPTNTQLPLQHPNNGQPIFVTHPDMSTHHGVLLPNTSNLNYHNQDQHTTTTTFTPPFGLSPNFNQQLPGNVFSQQLTSNHVPPLIKTGSIVLPSISELLLQQDDDLDSSTTDFVLSEGSCLLSALDFPQSFKNSSVTHDFVHGQSLKETNSLGTSMSGPSLQSSQPHHRFNRQTGEAPNVNSSHGAIENPSFTETHVSLSNQHSPSQLFNASPFQTTRNSWESAPSKGKSPNHSKQPSNPNNHLNIVHASSPPHVPSNFSARPSIMNISPTTQTLSQSPPAGTSSSPQITMLQNEYEQFNKGEHEMQKKGRGEKVFKYTQYRF